MIAIIKENEYGLYYAVDKNNRIINFVTTTEDKQKLVDYLNKKRFYNN